MTARTNIYPSPGVAGLRGGVADPGERGGKRMSAREGLAHIRVARSDHGGYVLELNGQDIARDVLAGSLRIEFPTDSSAPAYVTFTLFGDVELDLPDARVEAVTR